MKNITDFNPELLDLVMKDPEYVLYYGEAPLKTLGGQDVSDVNERLLQHLLVELSLMKEIKTSSLNSYLIFCIQKDFIELNKDPVIEYIQELIEEDFFIQMKITGQKESKVFKVDSMLDFFIEHTHIINLIFLGVSSV